MRIAKVILPIAPDKEFDYTFTPDDLVKKGMRALVDFRGRKQTGIVTGIEKSSTIKNLKPVIAALDKEPFFDPPHLAFAAELAKLYPYPQGEFLFMMLPPEFKKTKKNDAGTGRAQAGLPSAVGQKEKIEFITGNNFAGRYRRWKANLNKALENGSALICFPQKSYLQEAKKIIEKDFGEKVRVLTSGQKNLPGEWQNSRHNSVILGTRVSLFYYPDDLNLIIIEEENSPYYFQEEKPFYDAVEAAVLLSRLKNTGLIFSSDFLSLKSYQFAEKNAIPIDEDSREQTPAAPVRIVDTKGYSGKKIIGPVLTELLRQNLEANKKAVILWNRKEFANVLICSSCGEILKCENCSAPLRFSLKKKNRGVCPYCAKERELPNICPKCNAGYIKKLGLGIEKMEELLKSIFPEAKINTWDDKTPETRIIISTSGILTHLFEEEKFDAGFFLDADLFLQKPDYEATHNTFIYIKKLSLLFRDRFYVFTRNPDYYLFKYLDKNWRDFYQIELSSRKRLDLPPYRYLAKITCRQKNENNLFLKVTRLYNSLKEKGLDVYGPLKEMPFKLRGNFRYYVIIKAKTRAPLLKIIKQEMKNLKSGGLKTAVVIK